VLTYILLYFHNFILHLEVYSVKKKILHLEFLYLWFVDEVARIIETHTHNCEVRVQTQMNVFNLVLSALPVKIGDSCHPYLGLTYFLHFKGSFRPISKSFLHFCCYLLWIFCDFIVGVYYYISVHKFHCKKGY
jgi:hypothetical protein